MNRFCVILALLLLLSGSGNSLAQVEIKLPPESQIVSLEDLRFGETQVDQMMNDRPLMKNIVNRKDVIYEWAARRFGKLSCGERIKWSPAAVSGTADAQNQYPGPGDRLGSGFIKVRLRHPDGIAMTSQELWASAIFELYNISNGPEWIKLEDLAITKKIDRTTYIEKTAGLEYLAERKATVFYRDVWLPYAKAKSITDEPVAWHANLSPTLEGWKKDIWKANGYPYAIFGPDYDEFVEYGKTMSKYDQDMLKYNAEMKKYEQEVKKYKQETQHSSKH